MIDRRAFLVFSAVGAVAGVAACSSPATLTPAPDVVLPQRDPDTILDLKLTGPLAGYTWPINGKLYDPPNDGQAIEAGKRVRLRFANKSMMFHPMHLHGHTFQVV
jgi:FtsP/CotA-like multicopper oxidase with cupredoxin domain